MAEIDSRGTPFPIDSSEFPSCLLGTSDEYYRTLLAALDLGWQVEEPVYFTPDGMNLLPGYFISS